MKVFIGWDGREAVAYEVLAHSIRRQTKAPVEIVPMKHRELRKQGAFRRPWHIDAETGIFMDAIDNRPFSTEFSHTRFLVPYLMGYKGWALFLDSDMLFLSDVAELWEKRDSKYACQVVKHQYKPVNEVKMDGMPQSRYYKKNWSSFVLWNCGHPKNSALTPEKVSFEPGSWLHGFNWLDEADIGHLGFGYNWIEGASPANSRPKVVHYTEGGPWFDNYREVMFGTEWEAEYNRWHRDASWAAPSTVPVNAGVE